MSDYNYPNASDTGYHNRPVAHSIDVTNLSKPIMPVSGGLFALVATLIIATGISLYLTI